MAAGVISVLSGKRFVNLLAEDVAEVRNRAVDIGERRAGQGTEGETRDGGRWLVASDSVKEDCKVCQGRTDSRMLPDSCMWRIARLMWSSADRGSPRSTSSWARLAIRVFR